MLRRVIMVGMCGLMLAAYADKPIATTAGEWRIEVGPPGNEFYEVPETPDYKPPQPSEAVLRWAEVLSPHATNIEHSYRVRTPPEFRVVASNDRDQYTYYILTDGTLTWLDYKDTRDLFVEYPDSVVPEGRKYEIELDQLPEAMVATLKNAIPDSPISKAYYADTMVGPRFIAVVDDFAYYASPGGVIHCAGGVDNGALGEVSAERTLGPGVGLSLDDVLAKYGDRFDFNRQIKEKLSEPPEDGTFRYIAMGDCRSQKGLLEAMTQHIHNLDPKPKFVLVSGDVVQHGYADEYNDYLLPALAETDIPYFIAIGNHDIGIDGKAEEFRAIFGTDSLNFFFDYGKSRFVFLDNCSETTAWPRALSLGERWLNEAPEGYRTYVSIHKPPATIDKWAYHAMDMASSKPFTDLMTKQLVDEVYVGHIHAYSTATHAGVDYTLSGGAGAGLHSRFGPLGNVHHYVICDAGPDGVSQQVVRFYKGEKDE